jgi:probable phosphoglycerate mutase
LSKRKRCQCETKRIFLIRHGETDINKDEKIEGGTNEGSPLNSNGRLQAFHTGLVLREVYGCGPLWIFTSQCLRAKQTAEILRKVFELPGGRVIVEPGLNELDFGKWEGMSYLTLHKYYPREGLRWLNKLSKHFSIPGSQETIGAAQQRIWNCFCAIVNLLVSSRATNLVVVGHGMVNRMIIIKLLNMPLKYWARISQDSCGINVIKISACDSGCDCSNLLKPRLTIATINDTSHIKSF